MAVAKTKQENYVSESAIKEAGDKGYKGTLVWILGTIIIGIIFTVLSFFSLSITMSNILTIIDELLVLIVTVYGLLLIYTGTKTLSSLYKNDKIRNNFAKAFIVLILSLLISSTLSYILVQQTNSAQYLTAVSGAANQTASSIAYISNLATISIISLIITVVLSIIAYYFVYLSYGKIAELTNIKQFRTAGLIMVIGAILTIIVIGVLIVFIGAAYSGYAWYKLKNDGASKSTPEASPFDETPEPVKTITKSAKKSSKKGKAINDS